MRLSAIGLPMMPRPTNPICICVLRMNSLRMNRRNNLLTRLQDDNEQADGTKCWFCFGSLLSKARRRLVKNSVGLDFGNAADRAERDGIIACFRHKESSEFV